MKILLTNDDGYLATGIREVFRALVNNGHDVTIVAPERNSSGAGQSIAVYNSISIQKVEDKVYFVTSTPADSVRLGLQEIYGHESNYPDLVVSGVNLGENLAEDVLYSGTVGAAREGALHGIRALAFSTNGIGETSGKYDNLDSAALVVADLVDRIEQNKNSLPTVFVWNVNIPNIQYADIIGYETTKIGLRPIHQPLMGQVTPRNTKIYWQGFSTRPDHAELGTDLAVFNEQKRVSISPIEIIPNNYAEMPIIDAIIQEVNK